MDKGSRKGKQSKVKVLKGEWFSFFDMKMKWQQSKLLLQVYKKEWQQLKYVDKQSTHRPSTF
eukprot:5233465-Ditylum_brightwellii.AAC.1